MDLDPRIPLYIHAVKGLAMNYVFSPLTSQSARLFTWIKLHLPQKYFHKAECKDLGWDIRWESWGGILFSQRVFGMWDTLPEGMMASKYRLMHFTNIWKIIWIAQALKTKCWSVGLVQMTTWRSVWAEGLDNCDSILPVIEQDPAMPVWIPWDLPNEIGQRVTRKGETGQRQGRHHKPGKTT